jgi:hypothetical protein
MRFGLGVVFAELEQFRENEKVLVAVLLVSFLITLGNEADEGPEERHEPCIVGSGLSKPGLDEGSLPGRCLRWIGERSERPCTPRPRSTRVEPSVLFEYRIQLFPTPLFLLIILIKGGVEEYKLIKEFERWKSSLWSSKTPSKPTRSIATFWKMEVGDVLRQGETEDGGLLAMPQPRLLEMDEDQDQFSEGNYSDTQEYQSNQDSAEYLTQGHLFDDNCGMIGLKRRQTGFVAK